MVSNKKSEERRRKNKAGERRENERGKFLPREQRRISSRRG